jgi:hypothetical protein
MTSSDEGNSATAAVCSSAGELQHQFVVHLQQQARLASRRCATSASCSRTMAIFMMSAAAPWIGALIA